MGLHFKEWVYLLRRTCLKKRLARYIKTDSITFAIFALLINSQPIAASQLPSEYNDNPRQQFLEALAAGDDVQSLLQQFKKKQAAAPPRRLVPDQATQLNQNLNRFQQNIRRIIASDQLELDQVQRLFISYRDLQAAHLLMQQSFITVSEQIRKDGTAINLIPRLEQASTQYQSKMIGLFEQFEDVQRDFTTDNDKSALVNEASFIKKLHRAAVTADQLISGYFKPEQPRILRNNLLPYGSRVLTRIILDTETNIQPSYLNPDETQNIPQSEDLAETVDAPLSPEILEQARALDNDYIKIYEFVKNNIKTEWYAGSMKGAVGTLRQRSGNDVDQANLLIALFRASGLASRYVRGVIELPLENVMQSLGLNSTSQVTKALSLAGVAYEPVIRGGRIAAVNMAHTWVSCFVPYTNYRGAMVDASGSIWLPLMPAIKQYDIQAATGVLRNANIEPGNFIGDYLAGTQTQTLLQQLEKEVEDYLQTNAQGASLESQLGHISIKGESLGLLPSTLTVPVVAVNNETAALQDSDRHRIRFIARNGLNNTDTIVLDYTVALSQLAGERVTLSYIPATIDDQNVTNLYGGLDLVPAYLIKLRPQIKVNGRQKAVATNSLDTGIFHRLDIELIGPNGTEKISQNILSGSYHAVAFAAGDVAQKSIVAGVQECANASGAACTETADPADTEYLGAALLSRVAYDYSRQWTLDENTLAGLLNVSVLRPVPSVAVVSNDMQVETLLGQPNRISWQAVTLDAAYRAAQVVARSEEGSTETDFLRLSSLQGSTLEHTVFEDLFLADSMSADKGLQVANAQGLPVVQLNSGNFAAERPSLTHPQNVLADIENWINKGFTVTTPVNAISYNQWSGHVWRVEDPEDGSAGYFIAGGLAGGSTTQAPGNWALDWLRDALAAANTPPPNLNPGQAASIAMITATNGQFGTVGQPLDNPFAVIVRDASNKPVQGAVVSFWVTGGGGLFDGEANINVVTDPFGLASTTLTLGRNTGSDPVFLRRNESDAFLTQAGMNRVEALVKSDYGILTTEQPFSAIGFPGEATQLVRTGGTYLGDVPLGEAFLMAVQAQDAFGNSVSNVEVEFSTLNVSQILNCPANTPAQVRTLEGSGVTASETTRINGAAATLIAGAGYARYQLQATVDGIEDSAAIEVTGFGCTTCASIVYRREYTVGELGNIIDAAIAGESVDKPRVGFAYIASDVSGQVTSDLLEVSHKTTTPGAAAGLTVFRGSGRYEFSLVTSSTAGFNDTQSIINNYFAAIDALDMNACDSRPPQGQEPPPLNFPAAGATGLTLDITDIRSVNLPKGIDPASVYVNADNRTVYPAEVRIAVQPVNYISVSRDLDILEDGVWIGYRASGVQSGAGLYVLPRGMEFDPQRNYEIQLVLNRGTDYEVKSDPVELPVRTNLIRSYTPQVRVSQQIDILNQRSCDAGTEFKFDISENARITLEFADETDPDSTMTLIDDESYPQGENSIDITPGDINPGRYRFTLKAVAESDSLTEEKYGLGLVEYTTENNLPVGHTIVKGVDVFDGNLSLGSNDLTLPGRGVPIELRRSYSSNASAVAGPLGVGWTYNYNSRVVITPCGEVIVIGAAGGGIRFVDDGDGGLRPLRGYHGSLIQNQENRTFDFYSVDGTRYHYRNYGRRDWDLEFIEDTNGNLTKLGYDPSSPDTAKLITIEDPAGRRLNFTYEDKGFGGQNSGTSVITKVSATDGQSKELMSISYQYDDFGNIASATRENDSRSESYTYYNDEALPFNLRHKLETYTDPNGNTTTYHYESTLQSFETENGVQVNAPYSSVNGVNEPESGDTVFNYDFAAANTVLTNARSFTNTFETNRYGSVERLVKPYGEVLTGWTPDDVLPLNRTDANDVQADFSYDEDGNVTREEVDGGHLRQFTYRDFDGNTIKNRVETQQDRNGNITEFGYDNKGNLVSVTDPEGGVTGHTYYANGDKASTRDPNGNITRFKYDEYGNIKEVIDAHGKSTVTVWNAEGLPELITDALGHQTVNRYDTLGRLFQTENDKGDTVTYTYDDYGNKLTETDERGYTTTYRYDGENRLIRVEDPLYSGGDTHYQAFDYDDNGNKIMERDWNGNVTTFEYDEEDRLSVRTEPENRVTTYTYDANGNKLSETIINPNGPNQTTGFEYDELNRVTLIRDALNGETRFTYDGEGNKLTETDAESRVTSYTYDGNQRMVTVTDDDGGVTRFEYDANGNKTAEIDANGNRREFDYDALNRLIRARDALGNTTTQAYDAVGNLISVIDANLNEIRYEYDKLNRKERTIDPYGNVTQYVYDAVGNLKEEHLPNNNVVVHTYDNLNRLSSSVDNLGQLLIKEYDANGNVVRERDANNNLTVNTYDGLNRLTNQQLPENRVIDFAYDVFNNKISETDANRIATTFEYDALNRLTRQLDSYNNDIIYTYDAVGNKLTETDKRNYITEFEYDDLNRLTKITDARTQTVSMTYDAVGNKLSETDKRGTVTEYTYDKENRLETTTKDNIRLLTNDYDDVGNKVLEVDANNKKVVFIYDERNQIEEESRPLAAITRFQYDTMGDKIWQRDPEGRITTFGYDLRRRLISQTNGENETETYDYDGNGNRISLTRPENNAWTYDYDGADRLRLVTDPRGDTMTYTYDKNGNLATQTDDNSYTTTFGYDNLNRRNLIRYADGAEISFSYDENGNRTGMTDANGLSFTFVYDELNRETEKQYPSPANPTGDDLLTIVNDYDENNNLTQITETYGGATGIRVTTQRFDRFDRVFEKTDPNNETIVYGYDANGNRKTVKDPDSLVTTYNYDDLNRVSEVINAQGITVYRYDRSSLKTEVDYPNGTQAVMTYDNAGRVETITNTQNNAVVSSYEYDYDNNGNRILQIETNGGSAETTTYAYDTNDRLEQVGYDVQGCTNVPGAGCTGGTPSQTTTYTYDGAYNRLTEISVNTNSEETVNKTYTYNNRNQVTEVTDNLDSTNTATYAYDNNGNRINKTIGTVVAEFNYDVRDQLRLITQGGSSVGQFLYDYQGLRIRKETPTETLRYVYDDQSVLLQTDDSGNTISKYEYGPDRLLSLNNITEGVQFYLFDALGSVVNLTRPDGAIQTRIQYDAWGNVRNEVGSSANEFGFTGHEMDDESGLIYMKARFYDPELGQFLSQDSFEGTTDTPPSLHKYLYAAGNPVIYVDTNGNFFILGDMADGLASLRNRVLDSAGSLSNDSSARGFNRVAAGFAGVGAGVFGLLEGATRTVNFLGNLAVDITADENSENFFVKDARSQLDQTKTAVGKAVETITEHPKEVGTAIVNSVAETGAGIIKGEPGAIAHGTSTLSEVIGGGGLAGASKKLAGQTLKAAGRGVEKVIDATAQSARRVTKRIVENAMKGGGPRSKLARQVGAVGKDVDSNKIARELLQKRKPPKGSDEVIRVIEPEKPQFQLKQGEEGLSVFDAKVVTSEEILPNFRKGSQTVTRTVDEIKGCGLKVICTKGDDVLPKKLQDAHLDIIPGENMTRKQFKKALKKLEPQ